MESMVKEIKNQNINKISQTIEDITDINYNEDDIEIIKGEISLILDRLNTLENKIK